MPRLTLSRKKDTVQQFGARSKEVAYNVCPPSSMLAGPRRKKLTIYLTAMLFLHVFLAWHSWRGVRIGLPDFSIFYTAGQILHEGRGFELYNDIIQEDVQRSFSPIGLEKRGSILPYNHPPFEAIIFVPFVRLSYLGAYLAWLAVNLGLTFALLVVLRNNLAILGKAPLYLWLLAGLGFFPIFIALLQGQDSILVLFCYAMGFVGFRRADRIARRSLDRVGALQIPSGASVCFSAGASAPPEVSGWLFLCCRSPSAARVVRSRLERLVELSSFYVWAGENNQSYLWNSSVGNVANVRGIVASLCPSAEPRLRIFLILLCSAILLAGITYAWRKALLTDAVCPELAFALGLVATVLLSYHIYVHDLSVLFLAALIVLEVLLSSRVIRSWAKGVLYGCIGVLFCSPIYLLLTLRYKRCR